MTGSSAGEEENGKQTTERGDRRIEKKKKEKDGRTPSNELAQGEKEPERVLEPSHLNRKASGLRLL